MDKPIHIFNKPKSRQKIEISVDREMDPDGWFLRINFLYCFFKYSKLIELLIINYLKPNIEENSPPKVEEKKEYLNNEFKDEEILKFFSNI